MLKFLIRIIDHIRFRLGRASNRWRVFWLRCRGADIASDVWIGRGVEIRLAPGSTLKIDRNVVLNDYALVIIGPGSSLEIGDSTYVGRYCEISSNADSRIGRRCAIAAFCAIIDTDHVYQDPRRPIAAQGAKSAAVHVEDDVWLGYRTTVLKGTRLGRHSVVGAGGVVTRDVPPLSVAVGVPARVIKTIEGPTRHGGAADRACPGTA